MSRSARGLLAQVFVVLAIVAVASIALAPRGMLRAAVADDLDLPTSQVDAAPAIDEPAPAILLPGVRAVVSREEQDPQQALLEALTTGPLPGAAAAVAPPIAHAVDPPFQLPAPPVPTATNGDRAPPSSI